MTNAITLSIDDGDPVVITPDQAMLVAAAIRLGTVSTLHSGCTAPAKLCTYCKAINPNEGCSATAAWRVLKQYAETH